MPSSTTKSSSTSQPSATSKFPPAGVFRRLFAMVYDSLLVFAVLFAATIPFIIIADQQQQAIKNEDVVSDVPTLIDGWVFQCYLLLVLISFFCWFWRKNGQTLGMQAWRLQIEDLDGNRISLKQCLLRLLAACLSIACLGAGYWWIWVDKEGRSWHDHLSHSRMVLLPKKTK